MATATLKAVRRHAVVVVMEDTPLVTREWFYAVITCGRDLVLPVGNEDVFLTVVKRWMARASGFALPIFFFTETVE